MTKHTDAAEAVERTDLDVSIEEVTHAVVEITKMDVLIGELEQKHGKTIFPVDTPKGLKSAKEARAEIRKPRFLIEQLRKAGKAPVLELGRKLDGKAKEQTDRLLAIEDPIDETIKEEEQREERERQTKIEAELQRVEAIQERIANIRIAVEDAMRLNVPADHLAQWISDIKDEPIDESFQEFQNQAQDAKDATLGRLRELHTAALAREEEEKKIAAERAELEKLRAEAAEREAKERADIEAAAEEARVKRELEEVKQRAEMAEQQKKLDEEYERQAAERHKEAARQDIQNQINTLAQLPAKGYGKSSDEIKKLIALARGFFIHPLTDLQDEADKEKADTMAALESMLKGRQQYEHEQAEEQDARERNEMAMQEIQAIQHQVMIARTGRLGHVEGGTVEGVDTLIAETEALDITSEKFGALTASAVAAKQSAISNLKQYRSDLVREQEDKAEAERKRKAASEAKKSKFPGEAIIVECLVNNFGITEKVARSWLTQCQGAKAA